jgi:hypothetical protein
MTSLLTSNPPQRSLTSRAHNEASDERVSLPENIKVVAHALAATVLELLARSATFKRQCDTIRNARNVSVTVSHPVSPLGSQRRSRLEVTRDSSGFLLARVEFPALARPEFLAHDFEHIVEQLERTDDQAWVRDSGWAESERAQRAEAAARADLMTR